MKSDFVLILFCEFVSRISGGELKGSDEKRYRYYCPDGPPFVPNRTFLFSDSYIRYLEEQIGGHLFKPNRVKSPKYSVSAMVFP